MFVHGVGMTQFGFQMTPTHLLAYEAALAALQDASMSMGDIQAIVVATLVNEINGEKQRLYSALLSSVFQTHIPIIHVDASCGGGAVALWTGLRLGYDTVMVLGTDRVAAGRSEDVTDMIMQAADRVWEQEEGLNFPTACAYFAKNYIQTYGISIEDLGFIAYKNHQHAALNPKSYFYQKEVTLEQIQQSKVVADPLRVFDCAITVNGAAAVIISREKSEIEIVGSSLVTDTISAFERVEKTSWKATKLAANQAYEQAKIVASAIDVAEVHDAFTITELLAYEDLGFSKQGHGIELIKNGAVQLTGNIPINSSGGLKARGHPLSPTGLAQVYEIVEQMRGRCGERQIQKKLTYGLTHNVGGTGGVVGVHIFKKQ